MRRFHSTIFTTGMTLLSMILLFASPANALAAGGIPGGNIANPVVRAVDVAKPAIVRIFTTIGGSVTVHITSTQSATFPLNGGSYKLELSGSGAFISAHGDILTANHVVSPPHDSELNDSLFQMAAQDVADYINQNFTTTAPYTAEEALALMTNGNFRTDTHYGQPSSDVYFSTDYSGPSPQSDFKKLGSDVRMHVSKIEQYSATNIHDVALIHVNLNDTPSIQLGDSSNVTQLDELTIIGFPGNADITTNQDPTQILTSSVNKVYVSALKTNDMGSALIQVGGNVEHGDSGGPALDSNGTIVGVVSSYSSNADYPLATSFLQASVNAQNLFLAQGLDTTPGPFEKAWQQAFTDYASKAPGHWHKAQRELQSLANKYLNFNGVTPYLDYAATQATHEKLPMPTTSSPNYGIWAVGIVGIVLLIVIGALLFFMMKRKKSAPVAPVVPSTASGMQVGASTQGTTPTRPFPEWEAQRQAYPSPNTPLPYGAQPNAPAQAWPQQDFRVPTPVPYTPQQQFSGPLPEPAAWQQRSPVPASPTPTLFETWQSPSGIPAPPPPSMIAGEDNRIPTGNLSTPRWQNTDSNTNNT
ncbi:MAG: trypsin-like peptidase domain-containing protein [Ktedonobacteraceae bacterium]|nr:trypsin-like peptidase domain-containing protein [Ktedonobacteraceae bacterium]